MADNIEIQAELNEKQAELLLKSYQEGFESGKADGMTTAWTDSVRNIKNNLTIADNTRAMNLVGVPKSERKKVLAML